MLALARTCLVVAFIGGVFSIAAEASASTSLMLPSGHGGGPGSNSGNGWHNKNSFIINSPSHSNDVQHIRNVNVGGTTVTPGAICKKPAGHCRIVQRVTVFDH